MYIQYIIFISLQLLLYSGGDSDRDVFNEKPSKEEVMAATQVSY